MADGVDGSGGIRIVSMVDTHKRRPPEERDPARVVVIGYDDLMDVIRELGGSSTAVRSYADKLEHAIRTDSPAQFADVINEAYERGRADHERLYGVVYGDAFDPDLPVDCIHDHDDDEPAAADESEADLSPPSEPSL